MENNISSLLFAFPNLFDKVLSIDLGKTERNISITVTDAEGREILRRDYAKIKSLDINTSAWEQGVYILKITSLEKRAVGRLVKK